jgi:hypothetical protein
VSEPDPTPQELATARQGRIRREPRYRVFVVTGVVLGLAAAVVLTATRPEQQQYSPLAVFGYLAVSLVILGGLLGGLLAVLLVRRGQATSRTSASPSRRKPTRGK